jgi:hypothetical protein
LRQTCEFGPLQLFAVRDLQLGAYTKNPCVIDPNKPARNLCRERLGDDELAACCLFGDWDSCYIGVLAAIAATPVRQAPVSGPQPRQLRFSFIEPEL